MSKKKESAIKKRIDSNRKRKLWTGIPEIAIQFSIWMIGIIWKYSKNNISLLKNDLNIVENKMPEVCKFVRTYLMMISEMPTTPCRSTSSATENALCKGVFSGIICRSLKKKKSELFNQINSIIIQSNLIQFSPVNCDDSCDHNHDDYCDELMVMEFITKECGS